MQENFDPIIPIIEEIESLKQNNQYKKARELAASSIVKHSDDYRLYEELADICLFDGDIDQADEALSVARELHPESGTGMYLAGYIATAKGQFERAITELTVANNHMPNNAEILRNLGWAHVMQGTVPKWLSLLRRAHTLSPEEPMIINDLAVALMTAWEEAEARTLLKKIGHESLIDEMKNFPFSD